MSLRKTLYILVLFSLILPQLAMADGMLMPPPDYWIQETAQKAVIFYDGGVETMVVSITFQGDAEKFGWVIPAPSKPTITKGSDELFTSLDELTGMYYSLDDRNDLIAPLSGGLKQESVTVIETKQIEYYEVTTLSATDKDALTEWLNDNGYSYPSSASYILNSYIENGWFFVAMKINTESLEWNNVSQQLKTGHAVPVAISFETENIVYPLKISSVTSKPGQNADVDATFKDGIIDKGLEMDSADQFTLDNDSIISSDEGTLEMWVKPEWLESRNGIFDLLSVANENTSLISFEFQMYRDYSNKQYEYRLRSYLPFGHDTWQSAKFDINHGQWNHLAVTWKENEKPKFYLNGAVVELADGSSASYRGDFSMVEPVDAKTYIGTGMYNSSLQAVVDEMAVFSKVKTAEEIAVEYNKGVNGEALVADDNTTFLTHYDSELSEEVSGNDLNYVKKIDPTIDTYYSDTASIILYVFDINKKELPYFTTDYAGWIKKSEIEDLALNDQGYPWVQPSKDKYFLTKLSRTMAYTDMTEDLFFRDAEDNTPINAPGTEDSDRKVIFYVIIAIGVVGTLVMLAVINNQSKFKK